MTGEPEPGFTSLPDLASRRVGGSVPAASDELFAERENLIKPEAPTYDPYTFGHKGQVYDGWETRRRREPGRDHAIVRLGPAGLVRGVVVDTAYFRGNYPPEVSVEGCAVDGYPTPEELDAAEWMPLVPRSPARGDARNPYGVDVPYLVTHVRLTIYPDGGVARLRVHGEPVADPRFLLGGTIDLAAMESGGRITGCSNMFYGSPENLIAPGLARVMGEGWETARRRDDGNDWVEFGLAGTGTVRLAELDTTCFKGNAPGWASLRGRGSGDWVELLPRTPLQPDTRHRFLVAAPGEVDRVRMDVYPDGGMARVRLHGELSAKARGLLALRWLNLLPTSTARTVLTSAAGLTSADADALVAARPLDAHADLPDAVRQLLDP